MATIKINNIKEVPPEKFKEMLKETTENSSPIDDFIQLVSELTLLEQKYGIKSEHFYEKYNKGEMGDEDEFIHWAGVYHMFLQCKKRMEVALMRSALEEAV